MSGGTINQVLATAASNDGKDGDFEVDFEKEFFQSLMLGTKASNAFPTDEEELEYLQSLPAYKERMDDIKNRLTGLVEKLAAHVGGGKDATSVAGLADLDPAAAETFEPVSDVVDLLLENIDSYLDEGQKGAATNTVKAVSGGDLVRRVQQGLHGVITHANITRPQTRFSTPVDNSRPAIPTEETTDTPSSAGGNAVEAHARSLGVDVELMRAGGARSRQQHPKEVEIRTVTKDAPAWLFTPPSTANPPQVPSLDSVPVTFIDTPSQLEQVYEELKDEQRIAVDLENHSYRSFQGFLCLMQISTDTKDYLVDLLTLRDHMNILKPVLEDPAVLKVMHGADSDVVWLQRDFGIFLVGLFDTGQAARVMHYPSAGLAHALRHHCDVHANKAYQLADWRLRPLPTEMAKYAREDTHYLLYIFDRMRAELLSQSNLDDGSEEENNLMQSVMDRSCQVSLSVYEAPVYTPSSFRRIIRRRSLRLSHKQERVLAAVHEWRDRVGRNEDESEEYVMPQGMLVRVAQQTPMTREALEATSNPLPPVVRVQLGQLLEVIKYAAASPLEPCELALKLASDKQPEKNKTTTAPGSPLTDARSYAAALVAKADKEAALKFKNSNNVEASVSAEASVTPARRSSDNGPMRAHIGVNSSRTTFVPISAGVSGLEGGDASAGKRDRKNSLQQERIVRATPSPVLTTDQLYDTAGWQDLHDSPTPSSLSGRGGRRARVGAGVGVVTLAAKTQALDLGASPQNSVSRQGAQRARERHGRIGAEQLAAGGATTSFSSMSAETPFATMATAMAASEGEITSVGGGGKHAVAQPDVINREGGALSLEAIGGIESVSREDAMADSPADADALESDDIPRSMAEIYRISNRNRKRNKEKKKTKDEVGDDDDAANADNNKRSKNVGMSSTSSGPVKGGDDAVKFMLDIGWVDNANISVSQAPTSASGEGVGGRGGGGEGGRGSKRHGKPHSPRRRTPTHRGGNGGKARFDYSQGVAAAAGAVAPPSSSSSSSRGGGGRGRGGRGGGRSNNNTYQG